MSRGSSSEMVAYDDVCIAIMLILIRKSLEILLQLEPGAGMHTFATFFLLLVSIQLTLSFFFLHYMLNVNNVTQNFLCRQNLRFARNSLIPNPSMNRILSFFSYYAVRLWNSQFRKTHA